MAKLTMWEEWKEASSTEKLKSVAGLTAMLVIGWYLLSWAVPGWLHDIFHLPPAPEGAGFLYSVGWYSSWFVHGFLILFR